VGWVALFSIYSQTGRGGAEQLVAEGFLVRWWDWLISSRIGWAYWCLHCLKAVHLAVWPLRPALGVLHHPAEPRR
jgi:hypothetical protein